MSSSTGWNIGKSLTSAVIVATVVAAVSAAAVWAVGKVAASDLLVKESALVQPALGSDGSRCYSETDKPVMASISEPIMSDNKPARFYLTPGMIMGIIVLGVCLAVTTLISYMSTRGHVDNLAQMNGVVLIVFASLFIIVAGYDEKQMTPVIGLLGTVAGYVLRGDKSKCPVKEE